MCDFTVEKILNGEGEASELVYWSVWTFSGKHTTAGKMPCIKYAHNFPIQQVYFVQTVVTSFKRQNICSQMIVNTYNITGLGS